VARIVSDKKKLHLYLRAASEESTLSVPRCRHFGECGGCEFQNITYEAQLDLKRRALAFIAEAVLAEDAPPVEGGLPAAIRSLADMLAGVEPELVASPLPFSYRQRMDYVYAFDKAGLRRAHRHRQVVELEECPLLGGEGFGVFRAALDLAKREELPSYDYMRHVGDLRYFVVRRSRSGGVMLSLVTKTLERGDAVRKILGELLDSSLIVSGHWLHAPGMGDVSFGSRIEHVGEPTIDECLNGVRLGIGPNTFFQANPVVAETAYARIAGFLTKNDLVLDMYSGVGSIALTVAGNAGKVLAAENQPENVILARRNIAVNAVDNVELVESDAVHFLQVQTTADGVRPDAIVVNPPRPGVGVEGIDAIARIAPARIAYLSCNPFTLLRDMRRLAVGYALQSLTLFDMFPQTRHFETLALFERR
jgi:23S rRNA (uracil1939-C5)-methyltransferase